MSSNIFVGTDERWASLTFAAASINPPGSGAPGWDATTPGWLFDGVDAVETLHLVAQLPNSWREGTELRCVVHGAKSTSAAGDVRWLLDYKWAPIGQVQDADWTAVAVTTPIAATPDADTANAHLVWAFAAISATGRSIGDVLLLKLSREPEHADDTYGADARMLAFAIHHQVDALGSGWEYEKHGTYGPGI